MDHLDHRTVEERSYVERYHLGTLSAEEEQRFEAHFMDCVRCQEELEVQRSFTRGMKSVGAEEAARSAMRLGVLAWLRRRGTIGALAIAVVAGGLGALHLLRENARLLTRVAELAGSAPELAPAEVPVVLLGVVRGEGDAPATVADASLPWSLAIDAGADPRIEDYAVTLLDAAGEVRFERRDLRLNPLEVIQLTFPGGFLPAGDYRLLVRGALPGGSVVELGGYPLRVASNE